MSGHRQYFSDRSSWRSAVAASFPEARVATKVRVEARIVDGTEIAEWDFAMNTGWMRSIAVPQTEPSTGGRSAHLGEGETAKPAWYIVGSTGVNMTSHTSKPSFPDAAAAHAYIKTFSHAPGFKSAKVVFGTSDKHGFITPVDASSYLGEGADKIDWNMGKGDWAVAKREGARIFADYNKPGNTDAVLAVKTAAAAAQKKGSYLGAVILGLANDYFERQR
jgi:hypothetical protein